MSLLDPLLGGSAPSGDVDAGGTNASWRVLGWRERPLTTGAPSVNQVPRWNGSTWVYATPEETVGLPSPIDTDPAVWSWSGTAQSFSKEPTATGFNATGYFKTTTGYIGVGAVLPNQGGIRLAQDVEIWGKTGSGSDARLAGYNGEYAEFGTAAQPIKLVGLSGGATGGGSEIFGNGTIVITLWSYLQAFSGCYLACGDTFNDATRTTSVDPFFLQVDVRALANPAGGILNMPSGGFDVEYHVFAVSESGVMVGSAKLRVTHSWDESTHTLTMIGQGDAEIIGAGITALTAVFVNQDYCCRLQVTPGVATALQWYATGRGYAVGRGVFS